VVSRELFDAGFLQMLCPRATGTFHPRAPQGSPQAEGSWPRPTPVAVAPSTRRGSASACAPQPAPGETWGLVARDFPL